MTTHPDLKPLPDRKRWPITLVRVAGASLSVLAVGYVCYRVTTSADALGRDFLVPEFVAAIVVGALAYAGLAVLIGVAWHRLLASTGLVNLPLREALGIFGRSQVLKYLPSNLLHYVGRHAAAYRFGAPHGPLVWASIAETVLVMAAAVLVTALFAQSLIARAVDELHSPYWLRLALPAMAAAALMGATAYLLGRGEQTKTSSLVSLARGSAIACSLYVLFFLANGVLLAGLVATLPDVRGASPLLLAGIVALAWFAGFIVPGAPAGIGIRELLLTIGLEHIGFGASALSLALAYRIVTMLGDLVLALAAFVLATRWRT